MRKNVTYQKDIEAGICPQCRKHPARPNRRTCVECGKYAVEEQSRRTKKRIAEKHRIQNLKAFRENLESGRPEIISMVGEWLQSLVKSVEPTKEIECPFCAKEFSI
ncbi:MAG: hypothetical protein WCI45_00110 [Desulfuromonadales bacterium]